MTASDPMAVVERILQILDEGSTTATYKFAVLLALLDLCVELADRDGQPPDAVTTRQLAEAVIALYWPHVRPWSGGVLRQNASVRSEVGSKSILGLVHRFRTDVEARLGTTAPRIRARAADPAGWEALVHEVEWVLVLMPLPKLQRVRGQDARWLYEIGWNDTDQPPSRGQVRAYQRGRASTFDNQIRLLPGVGLALARLHGVLRPFIQHQWAAKVASLNGLPEADLPRFLFGADRTNLEPVRQGLVELQGGACFYCGGPLRDVHVDHFLPWARHPDDGLANLVAADRICNEQKRDYLASASLLNAWRRRLDDQLPVLGQVAAAAGWEVGEKRTLGAARSLYLPLPEDTRLWAGRGRWVTVEPAQVREALA